ncbi:sensor histidine kinase, partial [Leucobacter sp. M11]|uniref:sensor histidine kinase n=1 Tax=Leucobacter sp. M11 TaxID=2993565 RepID=UPI002D80101F
LHAQSTLLEEERMTSAAQAVALDRLEIARELHDVVAHHVSVMGIHAGAARRVLDRDPDLARESLELVEDSAQQAVGELRGLLQTLRSVSDDEDPDANVISLAQLPSLINQANAVGGSAELLVVGETRPLPQLVDVALFRIAQEGLTNVRKHAGAGAVATVRLRFNADSVELEIADD